MGGAFEILLGNLYLFKIALDFLLLGWIVQRRLWRVFPAFACYLAFSGLRSIALGYFYFDHDRHLYSLVFYRTWPLEIAALGWVVGDVLRRLPNLLVEYIEHPMAMAAIERVTRWGRAAALALSLALATLLAGMIVWGNWLNYRGEIPARVAVSGEFIAWYGWAFWLMAGAAALFIPIYREARALLSGIAVMSLFPAIMARQIPTPAKLDWVPIVSYMVFQLLAVAWLRSLPRVNSGRRPRPYERSRKLLNMPGDRQQREKHWDCGRTHASFSLTAQGTNLSDMRVSLEPLAVL